MVRISEIWLKTPKTRAALMNRLVRNMSVSLSKYGIDHEIRQVGPRVLVSINDVGGRHSEAASEAAIETAVNILSRVFGVKSVSPGHLVESTPEQIEYAVLKSIEKFVGNVDNLGRDHSSSHQSNNQGMTQATPRPITFKISVNRGWKGFKYTSPEFERLLGSRILEVGGASLKVNLNNPDILIGVDIRREFTFVYNSSFSGPGGMPYGTQGKVLALFSGGIDSPVSSWLMARRGAEVEHLFINTCCKDIEEKVLNVFDLLSDWYPSTSLYIVRAPEIKREITESVREGYRQVTYKAIMYKLANKLASKISAKVIVTGESLGQVSSQTLTNLATLTRFSERPVFRPLIGMDKEDIVKISKNIGLYSASSAVPEICKLETHSRTNVPPNIADKILSRLNIDLDSVKFEKVR